MTANPTWPEIANNLLLGKYVLSLCLNFVLSVLLQLIGQSATDQPDMVAHVFYQKQQALLQKIQKGYYGPVAGLVYTIKYQKRGLPHMHLLIFLEDEHKIWVIEQIDAFISAQIPDPIAHPQLYDAVSRYMIHNCSPQCCVENGRCKKNFPKSFCEQTVMKDDGYPEYARPDNGRTIQKVINNNAEVYTNEQVIPHPRELIVEFNSHINLEVCASIKSIKYVHKYIYKGPDHATLQTQGHVKSRPIWTVATFPLWKLPGDFSNLACI